MTRPSRNRLGRDGEPCPQRDYAIGRVKGYWALPIYHLTQHLPSGVLEIVSPYDFYLPRHRVLGKLQEVNLRTTGLSLEEVHSCQDGEIAKISKVSTAVRRRLALPHTRAWTTSGQTLRSHYGLYCMRKGQGVVGRAFSSKSACFCRDIRQLSITEYPLVPDARYYQDSGCFAACLQSSCSNNYIYVLEFFLPTNGKDYGDPRTLLHIIMEKMEERLRSSFKIASGQELGLKLTVEVIKISPEDEFDSFEICNTIGIESTPQLGEVQGGKGMMQLDFSSQQVDAANGFMNCIHEQQNGSVGSTPRLAKAQGEGTTQIDLSSQQVDTANAYTNGVHGRQSGIVGSPPRPEHAQGFVNISYQELMAMQFNASNLARVDDAANNSMNGMYQGQNRIVGYSPGQEFAQSMVSIADDEPIAEITVGNPERDGASIEQGNNEETNLSEQRSSCTLRSERGITRELLEQICTMNLVDASKFLDVSRSTLKHICREYGIHRWPPRKARKVNQAFAKQKVVQHAAENIEKHHGSDAARLEDDSSMWVIKAKYQEDKIKFELPYSAHKIDLEKNIAQRFNLSIGSFK